MCPHCSGRGRARRPYEHIDSKGDFKMHTRQRTFALLMGIVMLALMPLSISAAATTVNPQAGLKSHALLLTPPGGLSVPVAGTTSKGGKFIGNFNIKNFQVV